MFDEVSADEGRCHECVGLLANLIKKKRLKPIFCGERTLEGSVQQRTAGCKDDPSG